MSNMKPDQSLYHKKSFIVIRITPPSLCESFTFQLEVPALARFIFLHRGSMLFFIFLRFMLFFWIFLTSLCLDVACSRVKGPAQGLLYRLYVPGFVFDIGGFSLDFLTKRFHVAAFYFLQDWRIVDVQAWVARAALLLHILQRFISSSLCVFIYVRPMSLLPFVLLLMLLNIYCVLCLWGFFYSLFLRCDAPQDVPCYFLRSAYFREPCSAMWFAGVILSVWSDRGWIGTCWGGTWVARRWCVRARTEEILLDRGLVWLFRCLWPGCFGGHKIFTRTIWFRCMRHWDFNYNAMLAYRDSVSSAVPSQRLLSVVLHG